MTFDPEALLALELALARRDEASIPGGYDAVLAADFEEIGASGRHWTRAEILELLPADPPNQAIDIERFVAAALADGLVLATYDAVAVGPDGRPTRRRRSSIWVRRDGRWQLRFNQGTPVPTETCDRQQSSRLPTRRQVCCGSARQYSCRTPETPLSS